MLSQIVVYLFLLFITIWENVSGQTLLIMEMLELKVRYLYKIGS